MMSSRKRADVSRLMKNENFCPDLNHMSCLIIVPSDFPQGLLEVQYLLARWGWEGGEGIFYTPSPPPRTSTIERQYI